MKIIGLYGCYCHPYESWEDCEKMHKQKLSIGALVKQRHSGAQGEVFRYLGSGFYTVKYGPKPSDEHLEHAANLVNV